MLGAGTRPGSPTWVAGSHHLLPEQEVGARTELGLKPRLSEMGSDPCGIVTIVPDAHAMLLQEQNSR